MRVADTPQAKVECRERRNRPGLRLAEGLIFGYGSTLKKRCRAVLSVVQAARSEDSRLTKVNACDRVVGRSESDGAEWTARNGPGAAKGEQSNDKRCALVGSSERASERGKWSRGSRAARAESGLVTPPREGPCVIPW